MERGAHSESQGSKVGSDEGTGLGGEKKAETRSARGQERKV